MANLMNATSSNPLNNFKLTDLFDQFNCPDVGEFVFDGVVLSLDKGTITFSGNLKMDGPLKVFQNYLSLGDSVAVTATLKTVNKDLSTKLKPQSVIFMATDSSFKEIFSGVTLTQVNLQLSISQNASAWSITPEISGTFDVDGLTDSDQSTLQLQIFAESNALQLTATAASITSPFGIPNLILENIVIKGALASASSFSLNSKFTSGTNEFDFSGVINATGIGIKASATSFSLTDITNIFNEISPAGLALPDFDVQFKDTSISLATAACTIDGKSIEKGLVVSSTITAHSYTFQSNAQISSGGVVFDGELGDLKFGPVDLKKTNLDFQLYKKSLQKPAKFMIKGEAVIEGLTLDCGVYFEKDTTTTTVLYALIDASSFNFAQIIPAAKGTFVNELSFSKIGFVYASAACKTQNEGFDFDVQQGLQLMAILEEIPALSELTREKQIGLELSAHFGTPTDISIALPDTRLHLGKSVTTDPLKIQINITPEPALVLEFGLDVDIPNQNTPLHFAMSLTVDELEAKGAVQMDNYWKNPFGVNGLKIGPHVALQLDIIYEQFVSTGIPSGFGLAGGLEIAGTTVNMAVAISEDPMDEILSGELDNLKPADLINFASQIFGLNIPEVPDFFDLKKLEIYIAPAGGTIGTIVYQQGFSFAADMVIAGEEIAMYTSISDSGIKGSGKIEGMTLGPLKISGENGKDAQVDLELTTSNQEVLIDGCFSFLNSSEGLYLSISNHGLTFQFSLHFAEALEFDIHAASSGKISDPSSLDFELSGSMEQDIIEYLETTVEEQIKNTLDKGEEDITKAQQQVDQAQKEYEAAFDAANSKLTDAQNTADAELKKLQDALTATKSEWAGKISDAQNSVNTAKGAYDKAFSNAEGAVTAAQQKFDNGVAAAQDKLNQAQDTFNKGVQDAQSKLNAAQKAYDDSFGAAEKKVDSLLKKCHDLKKDHYHYGTTLAAYGVAYAALKAAKLVLEGIEKGGDYAAFQSAKAALSAAQTGVNYTALQAAKSALSAAQTGVDYGALQTAKAALKAVQTGTEYTAWQAAQKTLSGVQVAGQQAIDAANSAITNIGSTAAYVALEAAKKALEAVQNGPLAIAVKTAQAALAAAKLGAEGVEAVSAYLAEQAEKMIDITSFTFSAGLKAVESGDLFDAEVKGTITGAPFDWKVDLDVKNVTDFIHTIYTKLFDELKSLAKV
ncbi:hypothetical protein [Algoriphagus sediminis]|uniref:Uncharacterized protein n=1 Tax=Algoriphagus sediminis TaxID=3057113 RepID=A0ABT7YAG8_9BACT|nr:hypothetical protein [Algoriphagus sediminis]MDN3203400.1 hypothetical protein [Algoriphagus sediminis]